jgi:hypothetical protein
VSVIPAATAPADLVGYSIVLVGRFDPMSFQPSMLLKNGLLNEADLADLSYEMLFKEVCIIRLPWLVLTVEPQKLSAITTLQTPAAEPIRDFVLDFAEELPDGRFTALGINRDTHIAIKSNEHYEMLLERITASLSPFGLSKDGLEREPLDWHGILQPTVLRSIAFQGQRDDDTRGMALVRLEPSTRLSPGIYILVNDHFDADPSRLDAEPKHLLSQLSSGWVSAMQRAESVVEVIRKDLHAIA